MHGFVAISGTSASEHTFVDANRWVMHASLVKRCTAVFSSFVHITLEPSAVQVASKCLSKLADIVLFGSHFGVICTLDARFSNFVGGGGFATLENHLDCVMVAMPRHRCPRSMCTHPWPLCSQSWPQLVLPCHLGPRHLECDLVEARPLCSNNRLVYMRFA